MVMTMAARGQFIPNHGPRRAVPNSPKHARTVRYKRHNNDDPSTVIHCFVERAVWGEQPQVLQQNAHFDQEDGGKIDDFGNVAPLLRES